MLTQDGKNIQHLEDDIGNHAQYHYHGNHLCCLAVSYVLYMLCIGPFLLHWMPEVTKLAKPVDFLSLLINFVHYNATYLDEEVLVGLVQ